MLACMAMSISRNPSTEPPSTMLRHAATCRAAAGYLHGSRSSSAATSIRYHSLAPEAAYAVGYGWTFQAPPWRDGARSRTCLWQLVSIRPIRPIRCWRRSSAMPPHAVRRRPPQPGRCFRSRPRPDQRTMQCQLRSADRTATTLIFSSLPPFRSTQALCGWRCGWKQRLLPRRAGVRTA